jgi:hypothetical protein
MIICSPLPQRVDEPLSHYGARLLTFVLWSECPGTMSDDQLDRAYWAATQALSTPGTIIEETTTPIAVYDRLERVRGWLRTILDARARDRATVAPVVEEAGPGAGREKPHQGPMAPLRDVPVTRPPDGTHAEAPMTDTQIGQQIPDVGLWPRRTRKGADIAF